MERGGFLEKGERKNFIMALKGEGEPRRRGGTRKRERLALV